MKAAVMHGVRDVRFEEVPAPAAGEGEALLRVRACGICGSDLHTYREGLFEDLGRPVGGGRILGHEFAGEIVEVNGDIAKRNLEGIVQFHRQPLERQSGRVASFKQSSQARLNPSRSSASLVMC